MTLLVWLLLVGQLSLSVNGVEDQTSPPKPFAVSTQDDTISPPKPFGATGDFPMPPEAAPVTHRRANRSRCWSSARMVAR